MPKASKIIIQPVSCDWQLEASLRLRYQNYLQKGYICENQSMTMSDKWDRLAATIHFVAVRNGSVTGSVRLVLDSEEGLPMERVFPDEICQLRKDGGMLAEASALVTVSGSRNPAGNLWLRLSRHIFAEAQKRKVDNLCIAVTQNHLGFYERALFERIGAGKHYKALNSVFAYPLQLRVRQVQLKRKLGNHSQAASVQEHLLKPRHNR